MKRFQPRRYDPDNPHRDTRTDAQKKAGERNFRIFQLRGLASFRFMLTGERRERLLSLVDEELNALGAEPESDRIARQKKEFEELL
jgi:hypothetical protein